MSDAKISQLTSYTPALDADVLPIVDTANTTTKKITWANIKATLKTYFDPIYAPIATPSFTGVATFGGGMIFTRVSLTDGATVALDASLGNEYILSAAGDRTLLAPTNGVAGGHFWLRHFASGGARTLTLTTTANGFTVGAFTITQTASGKFDYLECIYNATSFKWDVINYVKGY